MHAQKDTHTHTHTPTHTPTSTLTKFVDGHVANTLFFHTHTHEHSHSVWAATDNTPITTANWYNWLKRSDLSLPSSLWGSNRVFVGKSVFGGVFPLFSAIAAHSAYSWL